MVVMSGITLLRGEELKMQLKPHMFSFFHLYLTFFLLLIWAYVIYDFFNSDKFSDFPGYDAIEAAVQDSEVLAGAIIWSFGLFLVGFVARYFFMDSGGHGIFRLYSGVALFGYHTTPYKVSIETENFKAIVENDLKKLSAENVFYKISKQLSLT